MPRQFKQQGGPVGRQSRSGVSDQEQLAARHWHSGGVRRKVQRHLNPVSDHQQPLFGFIKSYGEIGETGFAELGGHTAKRNQSSVQLQ